MTDDRQLEALLRDGLAAEARPVVADAGLTERIISSATADGHRPADPSPWQNWLVPAVAAVLVALLVGSVLFGTKLLHSSSAPPANRLTPTPSLSAPVSPPATPQSSAPSSPGSSSPSTTPGSAQPAGGPVPAGFSGYDLTWISADEGWALGTAPCSSAPCTSIVRTTDGGRSWVGLPAPRAYLIQSDTCSSSCQQVDSIRFVNADVGYVYGPDVFFLTTDGGQSWSLTPGNAWALEAFGGSVFRVTDAQPNCAPGCQFRLEKSAPGGADWTRVALPAATQGVAASLSVNGNTAVLATYGNPAGGANDEQPVLFSSTDAGTSWQRVGQPCSQTGGEVDAVSVAVAPDGSISVICQPRSQPVAGSFLATSTDSGRSFVRHGVVPGGSASILAATSATDVLAGGDKLYRWDGSAWQVAAGPGKPRFIGFETDQVGRVLADNGAWTTQDAGRTWTRLSY